jgi:hypothetical protein
MKMKNLLITLTLVLLCITNVQANVFASAVEISYSGTFPATISYSLNQNATSVVINIKDQSGAIVKVINIAADTEGAYLGFNDVNWDGTLDAGGSATSGVYSVEIEANDNVGSSGYEMISYDTGPDSWYWSSAGVAANTRQASPYFGMTYVAERTGGTSSNDGGGLTPRGIFLHDSYGRYFGQSYASAYASGNSVIDWASYADYEGSPWGVTVGPDDRTYAFVLSSNGLPEGVVDGGVAVGDALFSTASVEIILTFDHDAISDALVVGLGADRVLYTVEQTSERTGSDNDEEGDGDGFDAAHIMKYALGESTGAFTGAGEVVIPTATLGYPFRIEMDSEGYLYVVQQVWDALAIANNIYGLSKWDISGVTPTEIWHIGLNDAPEHEDSLANAGDARATNFNGLGLDEASGLVYVSRKHTPRPLHNVMSYNMSTGAFEASFCAAQSIVGTDTVDLSGGGGSSIRDVNVDAAGNVMVVNSSFEAFRIYSPAGANSYTTVSSTKIDVTNGTTDVEEISSELPTEYSLEQNYPNPFNPTTNISFSIPNNEVVTLTIYNSLGEKMSTLLNESLAAGSYEVNFDASGYSSGLYLYKINAGSYSFTKKMLLLK